MSDVSGFLLFISGGIQRHGSFCVVQFEFASIIFDIPKSAILAVDPLTRTLAVLKKMSEKIVHCIVTVDLGVSTFDRISTPFLTRC